MVSPSAPSTIGLDEGKYSGCHSRKSCPLPLFAPSNPSPVLTLQPSSLLLRFSLRKIECCPFNLTGFWKRAARSRRLGDVGPRAAGRLRLMGKLRFWKGLKCT